MLLLAFALVLQHAICQAVVKAIKEYDQELLGVDILLERLYFNLFTGRVEAREFIVGNPPGYAQPYLLRTGDFTFDLNVGRLLRSRGKEVEIEEFQLKNVDAIVEYQGGVRGIGGTSNVMTIWHFLKSKRPDAGEHPALAKSPKKPNPRGHSADVTQKKAGRRIIIKKLCVVDVGARICRHGGHGPCCSLSDIVYEDFSKECQSGLLDDVIAIVFKSVLKSIVRQAMGKTVADSML